MAVGAKAFGGWMGTPSSILGRSRSKERVKYPFHKAEKKYKPKIFKRIPFIIPNDNRRLAHEPMNS